MAGLKITDPAGKILFQDDFSANPPASFQRVPRKDGKLEIANGTWLHEPPLTKELLQRLRKKFAITKPIRRATAYVCGLGFYELHLNGHKVGNRELTPANTVYDHRLLFDTYDVTDALRQGDNAAASGWRRAMPMIIPSGDGNGRNPSAPSSSSTSCSRMAPPLPS